MTETSASGRAIASDADAAVLGIGLWHEREKDWAGAECAYRQRLRQIRWLKDLLAR